MSATLYGECTAAEVSSLRAEPPIGSHGKVL